jgi:hypothetical protein
MRKAEVWPFCSQFGRRFAKYVRLSGQQLLVKLHSSTPT